MNFFKKFNRLNFKKNTMNKKMLSLAMTIFGIGLIITGTSVAYLMSQASGGNNTITAGTLVLAMENESSGLSLNGALPMTDEAGLAEDTSYSFSLTNDGTLKMKYKIYLNNECSTNSSITVDGEVLAPDVCIPNSYIKVGLKKGTEEYEVLTLDDDGLLVTGILNSGSSLNFELKIWLDEDTPNDYNAIVDGISRNVIYFANLKLEAIQYVPETLDESGANHPSLATNMIPVYYDGSNWRKADENNKQSSYKWYDYNDKMWANAVTVTTPKYFIDATSEEKISKNVDVELNSAIYSYLGIINDVSECSIDADLTNGVTYEYATIEPSFDMDLGGYYYYNEDVYETTLTTSGSGLANKYVIINPYKVIYLGNYDTGTSTSFLYENCKVYETSAGVSESYPKYTSTSYTYDNKTGLYTLVNAEKRLYDDSSSIYTCASDSETSCTKMYKKVETHEVDKANIIKADVYTSQNLEINDYSLAIANGDIVELDDMGTMWVWIPRFNATGDIANYNGGTIETPGAFDITFVDKETTAHEAFTFNNEEKNGFWMGKFENSSDIECRQTNGSVLEQGCNLSAIRPNIIPNKKVWTGATVSTIFYGIKNMIEEGNKYNFDTSVDVNLNTHLIKNSEWGAVAYLANSLYGICETSTKCQKPSAVGQGVIAGEGGALRIIDGDVLWSNVDSYDTINGINSTTTGNIYGVYDMIGGCANYTMGVYSDGNNIYSGYTSTYHSGFNGMLMNGTMYSEGIDFYNINSNKIYYDVYTTPEDYTNAGLQHGIVETKGWYGVTDSEDYFVSSEFPWFARGGADQDPLNSTFFTATGAYGTGYQSVISSRTILMK